MRIRHALDEADHVRLHLVLRQEYVRSPSVKRAPKLCIPDSYDPEISSAVYWRACAARIYCFVGLCDHLQPLLLCFQGPFRTSMAEYSDFRIAVTAQPTSCAAMTTKRADPKAKSRERAVQEQRVRAPTYTKAAAPSTRLITSRNRKFVTAVSRWQQLFGARSVGNALSLLCRVQMPCPACAYIRNP
jgi:hypothetical protein